MKKLPLLLSGLIGIVFLSSAYATSPKIGIVDFQEIFSTSPKVAQLQKALQKKFDPQWAKITEEQQKLKGMTTKMERDNAVMRENDKTALKKDIAEKQKTLAAMTEDFRKKFSQAQREETQKLMDDIKAAIEKVAKSEKLDFVFHKDMVLYAQDQKDITKQVEKKLN